MAAHSLFSASKAERWVNCPGSLTLAQLVDEDNRSSEAADEGSALHDVVQKCLDEDREPESFDVISYNGRSWKMDDERCEAVRKVIEFARGISGLRMTEMRLNYAEVIGVPEAEGFGTGDILIVDGDHLHVMDAKFGRRFVGATGNKQMTLYAAGAVHALEAIGETVSNITMHILQPRVHNMDSTWEVSRGELSSLCDDLREAARMARLAGADIDKMPPELWAERYLSAGPAQCQWCPAAGLPCPELDKTASAAAGEIKAATADEFDGNPATGIAALTDLGAALTKLPLLDIYAQAVRETAMARLTSGQAVDGWKLVKGRDGNRKWQDEAAAAVALQAAGVAKNALYTEPKLKSPAQVEKAVKKTVPKDAIEALTTREPGKPTLASADDPRPTWTTESVASEFDVVTDA